MKAHHLEVQPGINGKAGYGTDLTYRRLHPELTGAGKVVKIIVKKRR